MFACIFTDKASSEAFQFEESRILNALDPFEVSDKKGSYSNGQFSLYHCVTYNTPESHYESVPQTCARSGLVIACWARIDNRSDLIRELEFDSAELKRLTDPQLILACYLRWGQDCVERLSGDFSFVIYHPGTRELFAARDPLGVKPLYYYLADRQLIVSSGARVFFAISGLKLSPDPGWMARYIVGRSDSYTETPWPTVKKLSPGHTLSYCDQKICLRKYFELVDDAPHVFHRSEDRLRQYKEVLEEVNISRLRSFYPLGSETSGGLDSSTVTGFAARELGRADLHTFGYAFCEDEPSYILETSRYHSVTNNHILTSMGTDEQLQESRMRSVVLLGHPEEHANGSSHDPFYRLCQSLGVRTLLSGFGGDEVVTNAGNLLLSELFDNRKYWALYQNLPGSQWAKPLRYTKTILGNYHRSNSSSRNSRANATWWDLYAVDSRLAKKHSIRDSYIGLTAHDQRPRTINQLILSEKISPSVTTRLENCTLIAAGRRIEYRWPLLDHRLLQTYLSMPSIEKFGGGFGRYLHRRAMVGLVPDKVTWKSSKAMGKTVLPGGYDSRSAGAELSRQYSFLIENLHPVLKGVVDTAKLSSQLPMIEKLDRSKDIVTWMPLYLQQTRIRNLNDWLQHYYH